MRVDIEKGLGSRNGRLREQVGTRRKPDQVEEPLSCSATCTIQ